MYLEKAKDRQKDLFRVGYRRPVPCSLQEVEELEQWVGHRLPEAYREFLSWMGHSGGGVLAGTDCFYRDMKRIQAGAKELLEENQYSGELPRDAFVFCMHQGYQFIFFHLEDGDDPPVYYYVEENPPRTFFEQIYQRFSIFVLTEVEGHIAVKERMNATMAQREQWKKRPKKT